MMQQNVNLEFDFLTIDAAACGLQLLDSLLYPIVRFTTKASSEPHCSITIAI